MVPHLTTALTGPLLELERQFLDNACDIEKWFRTQWQDHMPPFYGSTDLRNSGFKLAPVDLNLFPGGFNNLNDAFMPLCVQAAQAAIERICPDASKLLLIPENHTRNQFYLQNVAKLVSILRLTGLDVRIGSLLPDIVAPTVLELTNGATLTLEPLRRSGSRVGLDNFDPCAVLLNNDLSAGIPPVLKGLDEQWLIPPLHAGWHSRRKSKHAECYDRVAKAFADQIGIDPWRINPEFGVCGQINFQERTGEECLAAQVDSLLTRIRAKYKEYGVTDQPFVVVKEGLQVQEVIIQEGVHTFETVEDGVAEPVVYMMDHYVVGGFYRVHTERGRDENLNAPGMHFKPLAFDTSGTMPDAAQGPDAPPNRFYAYGVVARLALLAASVEIEETEPAEPVEATA
jgi:glutamate--cysteine ligase